MSTPPEFPASFADWPTSQRDGVALPFPPDWEYADGVLGELSAARLPADAPWQDGLIRPNLTLAPLPGVTPTEAAAAAEQTDAETFPSAVTWHRESVQTEEGLAGVLTALSVNEQGAPAELLRWHWPAPGGAVEVTATLPPLAPDALLGLLVQCGQGVRWTERTPSPTPAALPPPVPPRPLGAEPGFVRLSPDGVATLLQALPTGSLGRFGATPGREQLVASGLVEGRRLSDVGEALRSVWGPEPAIALSGLGASGEIMGEIHLHAGVAGVLLGAADGPFAASRESVVSLVPILDLPRVLLRWSAAAPAEAPQPDAVLPVTEAQLGYQAGSSGAGFLADERAHFLARAQSGAINWVVSRRYGAAFLTQSDGRQVLQPSSGWGLQRSLSQLVLSAAQAAEGRPA